MKLKAKNFWDLHFRGWVESMEKYDHGWVTLGPNLKQHIGFYKIEITQT